MQTVDETDARLRFKALLDDVEAGGEVVIARSGRPIARLSPLQTGFDRARARDAADGLRAASKGQWLDGMAIRDLLEPGRT